MLLLAKNWGSDLGRCPIKIAFTLIQNNYLLSCSQLWFPTVHDVLQADWHDVWHSPHPPFFIDSLRFLVTKVFTCFIKLPPT